MKVSTDDMAELLMLARVCNTREFMRLMAALGRTLRVPRADFEQTVEKFSQANRREMKQGKNKIPAA